MPLRHFRCKTCGAEARSLGKGMPPACAHGNEKADLNNPLDYEYMEEILTAPTSKMMETTDKERGKSKVKGLTKMLKERSRNYARDFEADDLIAYNRKNGIERSGFLKPNGKKRGKIDDK